MKNNITDYRYLVLLIVALTSTAAFGQSDSALNRSVTVERDFQPVIQAAGKVSTKPAVVETTIEPAPIEYSEYTAEVYPTAKLNPLLSQPTRFEPGRGYNGYVRGALGHPNTLFDFGYHLNDGKNSILDVYAHHKAEWGTATLSKSRLGLTFTHTFSTCDLFFGINGGNVYYYKYGHWYDYSAYSASGRDFSMWEQNKTMYLPHTLTDKDLTSLWTAEVFFGVKANAKEDFQYKVQTGYKLFSKPGAVSEHQVRTQGSFDWHSEEHHVGAKLYVQNNFLQLSGNLLASIPDSMYRSRHNFRVEPYYEYQGNRIRLHVGVNLDLNIGHGKNGLSGVDNLSFAPSPHINLEAQVAKQWLTLYADVTGFHGKGTLQSYMEENRYRIIHAGIIEPHCAEYTPVDGELGLHIRPYRDLLIELHGGYAYMMNQDVWIATTSDNAVFAPLNIKMAAGDFTYYHDDLQRGKIGGQINYHLQDVLRIHLNGDYFFWKSKTGTVYDRPDWKLSVRVDGKIDQHWSLYSDNHFAGTRLARTYDGTTYTDHHLRPTVDLNLGLQYNMWVGGNSDKGAVKSIRPKTKNQKAKEDVNGLLLRPEPKPNLTLFFQLNNWLHRKNDVFYGYRSQGINFLLGATFRF